MITPTSSSRRIKTVAECAALLIAALALSYLESLIPLAYLFPIPGFKLGFANLAVIIAFYRISYSAGAAVSAAKVLLTSLLFTGVTSFIFSFSGALFAFAVLLISNVIFKNKIGFIGISVLMAAAHNFGQMIAASFLMSTKTVYYYFPFLITAALICGIITGIILICLPDSIYKRKVTVS